MRTITFKGIRFKEKGELDQFLNNEVHPSAPLSLHIYKLEDFSSATITPNYGIVTLDTMDETCYFLIPKKHTGDFHTALRDAQHLPE